MNDASTQLRVPLSPSQLGNSAHSVRGPLTPRSERVPGHKHALDRKAGFPSPRPEYQGSENVPLVTDTRFSPRSLASSKEQTNLQTKSPRLHLIRPIFYGVKDRPRSIDTSEEAEEAGVGSHSPDTTIPRASETSLIRTSSTSSALAHEKSLAPVPTLAELEPPSRAGTKRPRAGSSSDGSNKRATARASLPVVISPPVPPQSLDIKAVESTVQSHYQPEFVSHLTVEENELEADDEEEAGGSGSRNGALTDGERNAFSSSTAIDPSEDEDWINELPSSEPVAQIQLDEDGAVTLVAPSGYELMSGEDEDDVEDDVTYFHKKLPAVDFRTYSSETVNSQGQCLVTDFVFVCPVVDLFLYAEGEEEEDETAASRDVYVRGSDGEYSDSDWDPYDSNESEYRAYRRGVYLYGSDYDPYDSEESDYHTYRRDDGVRRELDMDGFEI